MESRDDSLGIIQARPEEGSGVSGPLIIQASDSPPGTEMEFHLEVSSSAEGEAGRQLLGAFIAEIQPSLRGFRLIAAAGEAPTPVAPQVATQTSPQGPPRRRRWLWLFAAMGVTAVLVMVALIAVGDLYGILFMNGDSGTPVVSKIAGRSNTVRTLPVSSLGERNALLADMKNLLQISSYGAGYVFEIESPLPNGTARAMYRNTKGSIRLELVGPPDALSKATMLYIASEDSALATEHMNYMLALIEVAAPDAVADFWDWFNKAKEDEPVTRSWGTRKITVHKLSPPKVSMVSVEPW